MTEAVLVVVAVGAGTFASRFAFIALFGRMEPPKWLADLLPFVPPAVLAALVASIITGGEAAELGPRIVALLAAGYAAWRTRSVFWALAVGLPALWLTSGLASLTLS